VAQLVREERRRAADRADNGGHDDGQPRSRADQAEEGGEDENGDEATRSDRDRDRMPKQHNPRVSQPRHAVYIGTSEARLEPGIASASADAADDFLEPSTFDTGATLFAGPPIPVERAEDPIGQTPSVALAAVFAAPPIGARAPINLTSGPGRHSREYRP